MKNTNINALLEELDNRTTSTIIDDLDGEDTRNKMWSGTVCAHLVELDTDEYGIHLYFADSNNKLMPSYFGEDKHESIWAGRDVNGLRDLVRNIRTALHLPSTLTKSEVIKELEKPHDIVFYVEGKMGKKGMVYHNHIDYLKTMEL